MNWWFVVAGVSLGLAWLIKWWDRREIRKRNERIWAMLPEDVRKDFRHDPRT